jgi:hypothetical protein
MMMKLKREMQQKMKTVVKMKAVVKRRERSVNYRQLQDVISSKYDIFEIYAGTITQYHNTAGRS